MNKIEKYIPNMVSGVEPETAQFNTVEELLNVEFVKDKKEYVDEAENCKFLQYSKSDNHLMIEYIEDNRRVWWVVGTIHHPNKVDLPIFNPYNS